MTGPTQQTMLGEADCNTDLDQYFTHPGIARRVVEWTHRRHPTARTFIEPAAGRGALVRPLLDLSPSVFVGAWEIDPRMFAVLDDLDTRCNAHCGDFLAADLGVLGWDGSVMNTPYHDNLDALIARRVLDHCRFAVAIMRSAARHTLQKWDVLWRWVDVTGEINFVERPWPGAKTDYTVFDMQLRECGEPRQRGVAMPPHPVEWW
jgi:hypothetical protein